MLKRSYPTEDEIPEDDKGHYEEKDGEWELQVDLAGLIPSKKLDEFRNRNHELENKLKPWQAFIDEEVTTEFIREALTTVQGLKDGELIKAGKSQELIDAATVDLKSAHEKAIMGLTGEKDQAQERLKKLTIEGQLLEIGLALGLKKSAAEDLINRGTKVWTLDESGKPVAMEGGKLIYGDDAEPLEMTKWVAGLVKTAHHMFESSTGSDAPGSDAPAGDANYNKLKSQNPYDRKGGHFSLIQQGRLVKNPATQALAIKLGGLVGVGDEVAKQVEQYNARMKRQLAPVG